MPPERTAPYKLTVMLPRWVLSFIMFFPKIITADGASDQHFGFSRSFYAPSISSRFAHRGRTGYVPRLAVGYFVAIVAILRASLSLATSTGGVLRELVPKVSTITFAGREAQNQRPLAVLRANVPAGEDYVDPGSDKNCTLEIFAEDRSWKSKVRPRTQVTYRRNSSRYLPARGDTSSPLDLRTQPTI